MQASPEIHLLPEHLIDQIKAGEVIEKVSTLVKELIENSLDAKAEQIDLHLINGGLDLVHIKDNGTGISFNNIPLAFARHATSKIRRFEDLYTLFSYGFRGEALASIASISKLTCESFFEGDGTIYKIDGGQEVLHEKKTEKNISSGTQIYIRDLFYNTPVRMKFLKSQTSEKNAIKKIFHAFLLANPSINFSIRWDNEDKKIYPPTTHLIERIKQITKNEDYFSHQAEYDQMQFKVFLSKSSNRGTQKKQFLFVNNRFIQDPTLHKIILNAARALWPDGASGNYFAYLNLPADQIDINVHPNKTQVKLFKSSEVYGLVTGTIKDILKPEKNNASQFSNEQKSFLSTREEIENKTIDYKKIDFSSSFETQNYLSNIHSQSSTQPFEPAPSSPRLLLRKSDYTLIEIEKSVYITSISKCLSYIFSSLFESNHNSKENIPLLISYPIKAETNFNKKNLQLLQEKGFELEALDPVTYVLRSYPAPFEDLPYLSFLEQYLHQESQHIQPQIFTATELSNPMLIIFILIEMKSISELIEAKLLKELTTTKLQNLYEK